MISLEKEYLDKIAEQIFPTHGRSEKQYELFKERFYPNNYECSNTEIAKGLSQRYKQTIDYETGLPQNIKEIIKKINNVFREELEADGITEDLIGCGKQQGAPGRRSAQTKSPWQIVYQWLWGDQYSLWLQDYIWESWKQTAQTSRNWLKFNPLSSEYASKGIKIPPRISKKRIPAHTPLNLKIEIDCSQSYLILFNLGKTLQGEMTKYLITPSQAFAPHYQLRDKNLFIPQEDALCEDLQFNTEGIEEFMAIVIDRPLTLPWLNPNSEDPAFKWQGKHLGQLWKELKSGQYQWQIFYYDVNVTIF